MAVKELKDIFVYDLMAKLKRDSSRARAVQQALDDMDDVHRKVQQGKADRSEASRSIGKVVSASGFNFGLIMPKIFPRYPMSDPLSMLARPFMFTMTSLAANTTMTLRAGRQVGKCADGDTTVVTESRGDLTLSQIFDMGVTSSLDIS